MQKKTLFNKVIYKGIMGSIFGIVAGLLLGILIFGLEQITSNIYIYISARGFNNIGAPIEIFLILGMGFGAVIGSIFGCLTAYKEGLKD